MTESNDYFHKQAAKDTEYTKAYRQWVESLSPQEKAQLSALGVDKPDVPRDGGGYAHDATDLPEASYVPDIAAEIDQPTASQSAPADTGELRADTLASFCARIRSAKNPLLVFDAVCFATGVLALDGASQTEIAARHGVSRAAFSKIATQWCKTFGIKPSRGMKSERARDAYKRRAEANWQRRSKPKLPSSSQVDAQPEE